MTDDEIDAVLLPLVSKHIGVAEANCRILPFDRLAYRAGMLRASEIARELALEFAEPICEQAALRVAAAIERAASEPPAA